MLSDDGPLVCYSVEPQVSLLIVLCRLSSVYFKDKQKMPIFLNGYSPLGALPSVFSLILRVAPCYKTERPRWSGTCNLIKIMNLQSGRNLDSDSGHCMRQEM